MEHWVDIRKLHNRRKDFPSQLHTSYINVILSFTDLALTKKTPLFKGVDGFIDPIQLNQGQRVCLVRRLRFQ